MRPVTGGLAGPAARWQRGAATDPSTLGDPSASTPYAMCVYDEGPEGFRVAIRLDPAAGELWRRDGERGWRYGDGDAASDGISRIAVTNSVEGRASASVKAGGPLFPVPAPATPSRMFEQGSRVVAQLVADDPATACWTSSFETSQVRRHHRLLFDAALP